MSDFKEWAEKQSKAKKKQIQMLMDFGVSESAIREKLETVKRGAPGREVNIADYGYASIFSLLTRFAHKTKKVDGKIKQGEKREKNVIDALVKNAKRAVADFEKSVKESMK